MTQKGSRAGARNPKHRSGFGRIPDQVIAWLRTATTGQVSIHEIDPTDDEEDEHHKSETGLSVVLMIPIPGRQRPMVWDITGMTEEELTATRRFFDHLFDKATPVVLERDKVAQHALEQGDDSFRRVYRTVPELVIRERPQRGDSPSLRVGPESPADGAGSDGSPS